LDALLDSDESEIADKALAIVRKYFRDDYYDRDDDNNISPKIAGETQIQVDDAAKTKLAVVS